MYVIPGTIGRELAVKGLVISSKNQLLLKVLQVCVYCTIVHNIFERLSDVVWQLYKHAICKCFSFSGEANFLIRGEN